MNRQKFSNARDNFRMRRYAVSLGRRYVMAAASVVLLGVLGCSSVSDNSTHASANALAAPSFATESKVTKEAQKPNPKLIDANTKFGFKLFSQLQTQDSGKNLFISPSSVAIALAMTYNGASGSTQQAMARTLELQGLSLEQINSSYAALKNLLENLDPKVQLTIANSLWADKNASFQPDFLKRNRDFYKAKVTNLDFQDRKSPSVINNWVKESTRGKINEIVQQIRPEQVLFLVNAIYFKGSWTEEFDKKQTTEKPFYLASGGQKNHPLMSQSGKYEYLEHEQFQAVSLPYGNSGKVSFYIFLPKQNSNLKTFYQNLNAQSWEGWISKFKKREGSVQIPRFKMDYDVTLNNSLTALGMGEAFSDRADFSAMGSQKNLSISEVKHKTFLEVNEEGTEAAAATSVGVMLTSMPVVEPFRMVVDRPFFCAIRDNQTGSVLFMGSIVEPKT
ncbi:MAG: serpin family protein [Scytonematopsis contorta HA4267-MV1]|jgi:serpin B|nr:serpin family protein [Scytonematopsis contorta HA4267-MV1]